MNEGPKPDSERTRGTGKNEAEEEARKETKTREGGKWKNSPTDV